MKLYHGTKNVELKTHCGICFTDRFSAAQAYGDNVFVVEFNLGCLKVVDATDKVDRDNGYWPGDTTASRDHYECNEGADLLFFLDETPEGTEHDTYRFLSDESFAGILIAV